MVLRKVCKSWSAVVPKPEPIADLRDFSSTTDWLALDPDFIGVTIGMYHDETYQDCVSCAIDCTHTTNKDAAFSILVQIFTVGVCDSPCARNVCYKSKYNALVYTQNSWSLCPAPDVARKALNAAAVALNAFIVEEERLGTPSWHLNVARQVRSIYMNDPESFTERALGPIMSFLRTAWPEVRTD